MSTQNIAELLQTLRAQNMLSRVDTEFVELPPGPPWYISLMLGVCAWVANLILLAFFGFVAKLSFPWGIANAGLMLMIAAAVVFWRVPTNTFLHQMAFAASLAGQIMLLAPWADHFSRGPAATFFVLAVVQAASSLVMRHPLHRMLSAFFACLALAIALRFAHTDSVSWFWGRTNVTHAVPWLPHLLFSLPLAGLVIWLTKSEARWLALAPDLFRPITQGLILGLAFGTTAFVPESMLALVFGNLGVLPAWLGLIPVFDLSLALLAAACAYALGSTPTVAACIVAAFVHLAQFYYSVGVSLLSKSAWMAVVGALALLAGHWLSRQTRGTLS